MSTTIGGGPLQLPAVSSLADVSRSAFTWQVTASGRATLWKSNNGVDVGLVADITIPVGSESPTGPHNPVVPSRAIRFGMTSGF
jgi:hypothetical protein